jgi:hypothetical protein
LVSGPFCFRPTTRTKNLPLMNADQKPHHKICLTDLAISL